MSSAAALCEIERAKDVEQRFLKYLQETTSHSQVVEQIVQGKYYMEDSEVPKFCKCFSVCVRITIAEPIRHHFPFDKWDRVFGNGGAALMHMQLEVTSQGHSHYTLLLPEGSPENGGGYVLPVPQLSNHPSAVLKACIEDATHKDDAQDVDVPTSAVLEAQIAEATHKGDAQEVDVPSSAVLEAYAHDLPLPMTSYLTSQRCEVSCGVCPFGDPHGWPLPVTWLSPMTVTSRCPISIPCLNYLMIESPDIPIRLSSSAVLQAYLKVQS